MPGTSEQRDGIKARTEFLFYLCVSTLVVNNCAKFSASGDAQCVQTIQIYYGPRSNVDVLKHFRALFPIIVCAVVRVWPNISRLSAKHGCKILSKQSIVFFGTLGWPAGVAPRDYMRGIFQKHGLLTHKTRKYQKKFHF